MLHRELPVRLQDLAVLLPGKAIIIGDVNGLIRRSGLVKKPLPDAIFTVNLCKP